MNWLIEFEESILLFIQNYVRLDVMNGFWKGITFLGDSGWFWIVLSIILIIFKKTRKVGMVAIVSLFLCFCINNLAIKNLVARPRPYTQIPDLTILVNKLSDYSFPSGHSCASFAAACTYYRMFPKKYGIGALILATLIAFSRLYVGVHYPGDVLVGSLIGIFGSLLVYKIYVKKYPIT